ncbi:hypothetical protein GQ55_3G096400 [Panicum hallii var. hallii]|uniref:Uncharacterized protein n=1 Tax=Panicum hallii var. hallii TaxID=1504633 RepID=A0A2T7E7K0_9POAL|nr:hypothetical protein GQ55_3G096400 [Panicum hallii var. hallii]
MRFPLTFSRHRPAAGALPLAVASPAPGYFAEQSLIFSNTPYFLSRLIIAILMFTYSPGYLQITPYLGSRLWITIRLFTNRPLHFLQIAPRHLPGLRL